MRSLFFISRHGETVLNESGRYRGWSDGPDAQLNAHGITSANEQGQFFKNLGQKFVAIYCSPLGRSKQTAAIVAGYLGIKELIVDPRLYPLNVGDYAGQVKSEYPIAPFLKDRNKKFPGGDSINEFEASQRSFGADLLAQVEAHKIDEDHEILVCAHTSNVMYWWNLQSNRNSEEYLDEKTDLLLPGGAAVITEQCVVPIFRANPEAEIADVGGTPVPYIDARNVGGEPHTGYAVSHFGGFRCKDCEYLRAKDHACQQQDMVAHSKLKRTEDNLPIVEANGCCVYIEENTSARESGSASGDGAANDKS